MQQIILFNKTTENCFYRGNKELFVSRPLTKVIKKPSKSGSSSMKNFVYFSFGFMLEDNLSNDGESTINRTRCDYYFILIRSSQLHIDINAVNWAWILSHHPSNHQRSQRRKTVCCRQLIDHTHYETLGVFMSTFTAYLDDQDPFVSKKGRGVYPSFLLENEIQGHFALIPVKTSSAATGHRRLFLSPIYLNSEKSTPSYDATGNSS